MLNSVLRVHFCLNLQIAQENQGSQASLWVLCSQIIISMSQVYNQCGGTGQCCRAARMPAPQVCVSFCSPATSWSCRSQLAGSLGEKPLPALIWALSESAQVPVLLLGPYAFGKYAKYLFSQKNILGHKYVSCISVAESEWISAQ